MATLEELLNGDNRFMFCKKVYRLSASIPEPVIEMINEEGEIFSFGINGNIKDDFILIPSPQKKECPVFQPKDNSPGLPCPPSETLQELSSRQNANR